MYPEITNVIKLFKPENITKERKKTLEPLVNFIANKVTNNQEIRLNMICTHNSRRSHLAQVWTQTVAAYFNIKNVFCYSGGTEYTAMYPMVIKTLKTQGFKIKIIAEGDNPIYSIKYAKNEHPVIGFSKIYSNDFNPKSEFVAIMTCGQADAGCPLVAGAEKRIAITFEDPKVFDDTPQESEKYEERSLQIATEMFYVFSQIKQE